MASTTLARSCPMSLRRSGAPRQDLSPAAGRSPFRSRAKGALGAALGRDRGVSRWLEGGLRAV